MKQGDKVHIIAEYISDETDCVRVNIKTYRQPESGVDMFIPLSSIQLSKELLPFTDTHHADEHTPMAEQAYRRGYYQGYATALDDLTRRTSAQCWEHLYGELYKWRYEETKTKWIEPPEVR